MKKTKMPRILITSFLLFFALWIAIPKVYVHKLFNHHHDLIQINGGTSVQPQVDADCDFDKYDTPVYFTIFNFINKFIPLKSKEEARIIRPAGKVLKYIGNNGPSRAPPVA